MKFEWLKTNKGDIKWHYRTLQRLSITDSFEMP